MKKYIGIFLLTLAGPLLAAPLPDNLFFKAMQDEMQRTQKELRVPGSPKPFFTAYKMIYTTVQSFSAAFGVPYAAKAEPESALEAAAYIYAGNAKNNSSGFDNNVYYYQPLVYTSVPLSYEAIRRALWRLTDTEYIVASTSYERKEAYKRQKNIINPGPDFTASPKASYVQNIEPMPAPDAQASQQLVNVLSALGKELPFLEYFGASIHFSQRDTYFLDSEGDFYQYSVPLAVLSLSATLRNKDGYEEKAQEERPLAWGPMPDQA